MRTIFIICLMISTLTGYAQEENPLKGYISLKGNFSYNQQGILTLPNQVPAIQKTTSYRAHPTFLKSLSSTFYVGVGVNYDFERVETKNPNVLSSGQRSVVIERGIAPTINGEWFKPLAPKLTFSISGHIFYSFITKDQDSYYIDLNTGDVIEYSTHWDANMIGLQLNPNIRYQLFNKIGIQLAFATIEWNKKINDTRFKELDLDESNIRLGLDIEDWEFGLFYNIR